ncbi:uncharacterized protein [Ptychodera flava]|uniref:uncharacterized protein n=1 Tax=Ptychodera flava TaxID=63121 RepID=UPI00396A515D
MQLLVQLNIFEEVYVSFLPVGHTHENVDQMFSKISSRLQISNAYTMDDLETTVIASYTPPIKWRNITEKHLFNIKEWLIPHMPGKMQGHSKQHNFRFHKVNGTAYMQYRQWCTDPWEPSQRDENGEQVPGIRCLKSIQSANDVPMYVIPSTEKMDLPNLKRDVPGGFGVRLPSSAVSWWEKFLGNAKDLDCVPGNLPRHGSCMKYRKKLWQRE